jgi:predicted membrane channel-forming protein YqfA (hemolysin III family)
VRSPNTISTSTGYSRDKSESRFAIKEEMMNIRRLLLPVLITLFGLYCMLWWGLLSSSMPANERFGGAFFGVLLLLLATVYLRLIPRVEQQGEPK